MSSFFFFQKTFQNNKCFCLFSSASLLFLFLFNIISEKKSMLTEKKGSFTLQHIIVCSKHASSNELKILFETMFVPWNENCPALVQKPAVPLKRIHDHNKMTYRLVSAFLSSKQTICDVNDRISRAGYGSILKGGIGCTEESAVEAQAEGALTASRRMAWSSWVMLSWC